MKYRILIFLTILGALGLALRPHRDSNPESAKRELAEMKPGKVSSHLERNVTRPSLAAAKTEVSSWKSLLSNTSASEGCKTLWQEILATELNLESGRQLAQVPSTCEHSKELSELWKTIEKSCSVADQDAAEMAEGICLNALKGYRQKLAVSLTKDIPLKDIHDVGVLIERAKEEYRTSPKVRKTAARLQALDPDGSTGAKMGALLTLRDGKRSNDRGLLSVLVKRVQDKASDDSRISSQENRELEVLAGLLEDKPSLRTKSALAALRRDYSESATSSVLESWSLMKSGQREESLLVLEQAKKANPTNVQIAMLEMALRKNPNTPGFIDAVYFGTMSELLL